MSTQDLSALVSARLCHDLISPIGAIGNGLELLQMSEAGGGAELALISDSLDTALARLRFYRIAFGIADPAGRLSCEVVSGLTDAMYSGRFTVAWQTTCTDMPRPVARLIGLAILCLEKSLPTGGLVRVSMAEDTVGLAVAGWRTAALPELWDHVTEGAPIDELRPDSVQFALLRRALAETRHAIDVRFTEDGAALNLTALSPLPA